MLVNLNTVERRIGVVGTYASGKTVFLTSLINHLQEHDPERFRLGEGTVMVRKFQELPPDPGWVAFDYARHRDRIVNHGGWPAKTRDRSQYVCRFERSDWLFSDALLKFYDMPGERIADTVMAAKDYAGWSDHVLDLLSNDADYLTCSRPYLNQLQQRADLTLPPLLSAYRQTLARLALAYKPYVSPSTFLLSSEGKLNKGTSPASMENDFFSGLSAEREFVPLPAALRQAHPDWTAQFSPRYESYRQQIVFPLIQTLKACHALIVLVDVTMLLRGGVGMYNDNRQLLLDLLDVLSPGQSLLGELLSRVEILIPRTIRPSWIRKIAFVATKLDQVHQDDQDNMTALLRAMIERPVRNHDGLSPLFSNCSAVVSTEKFPSTDRQRWLLGLPVYDAAGNKRRLTREDRAKLEKFVVSPLPSDWPANWAEGEYSFPDVYPRIPPRKDCPPDQLNLNRILDFVMR